jgi:hypothetical protein
MGKFKFSLFILCVVGLGSTLSGCSDSSGPKDEIGSIKIGKDFSGENILPYGIVFRSDGSAMPVDFSGKDGQVRIVKTKDERFPIEGKIKRVETITLVTYEASCDVLVKTSKGYKTIVIENDAICDAIKP